MPKVGSSNEALYERAMFVYTGSLWVPLKADASGQLAVGVIAGQALQANMAGYFGSAWQKQALLLGYAATVAEDATVSDAPAGANTINGATVPANEVWVIQAAACKDTTHAPTSNLITAVISSVTCPLQYDGAPTANHYIFWNGELTLAPGDNIRFFFSGVTLHDVLPCFYVGRKFYTNL
jgi:hypothetical protein